MKRSQQSKVPEGLESPKRSGAVRTTGERRFVPSPPAIHTRFDAPNEKVEALLAYLKNCNGFDFTGYKRPSVIRRIELRMSEVRFHDFGDYLEYLKIHPAELTPLFNHILINVTEFFRNPPAWRFLVSVIIPRILKIKRNGEPIRIWSPGCASGEEVYTLAMVFAEALGLGSFRQKVTIFGSDVDTDALDQARRGSYRAKDLLHVPTRLRLKYFKAENGSFMFMPELRPSILFSRHDVIHDPPFSHLDLIVCRNALIYFNLATQQRVLARFHIALSNPGYLFLGKGETILNEGTLFKVENRKFHIYAKVPKPNFHDRIAILAEAGATSAGYALSVNGIPK